MASLWKLPGSFVSAWVSLPVKTRPPHRGLRLCEKKTNERALEIIGSRLPQDEPQLRSRLVKVRAYERGS